MDLNLFLRVVQRFKIVVIVGFLLATLLAVFSYARISPKGLTYRQPKEWASHDQLLVTQPGFPLGQATTGPGLQAPGNLATQAVIYSSLAQSGAIRAMMLQHGPVPGVIQANAEMTADNGVLPIIDIAGVATTPKAADETLRRGTAALREYLVKQQTANGISQRNRIILDSLAAVGAPTLMKSPSITRPIFVFVAVMLAVIGLAFILENLRPRIRMQPPAEGSGKQELQRTAVGTAAGQHTAGRRSG